MLVKKTFSVFLLIVGIMLILHPPCYGDRTSEILREVMVMFKAGTLQLSKGLDSGPLDQIQILSPQVESALRKHRIEMILKAFPDFDLGDTLGFTPDGRPVYLCDLSEIYKIRLPEGGSRDSLIRDLTTLPDVIYAEPNGMAQPAAPIYPNDPLFEQGYQWNLYNYGQSGGTVNADIDAPEAWEIFTGSSNVKIGIIDGGVENWHEDLSGKVSGDGGWGWEGHGFHVAGIAAAKTENDVGIAGVDWNAQIISQRIDNTDYEGIYNAIMDAVNAGADVLNNSWIIDYSITVRLAFANAYKLNRVAVAIMGNEGTSQTHYPAGFGQGIIAVGATTRNDVKAGFSNWGNHIDVTAPGVDIMSCVPYQTEWGYYQPKSGTSMAAPHVSGLASLLKGYKSDLYNDDIEQIIRLSAEDVNSQQYPGWDEYLGTGRINARGALDSLASPNCLAHWTAGGGYQASVTDYYTQIFYGVPGLADGPYYVKKYEVRHDVTFPKPFASTPYAWGRGAATIGYSAANPNFGMGYCDFISLTSTGGTLRTWVYDVWTVGGDHVGWIPCAPGNVNFAYTIFYHNTPTIVSIAAIDTSIYLQWFDNYTNELGYIVERKDATSGQWSVIDTTTWDVESHTDYQIVGSETYYYRIKAYNYFHTSGYSNEVTKKARPWPPKLISVSNWYCNRPTHPAKITPFDPGENLLAKQTSKFDCYPPYPDSLPSDLSVIYVDYPTNQKLGTYAKIGARTKSCQWYNHNYISRETTMVDLQYHRILIHTPPDTIYCTGDWTYYFQVRTHDIYGDTSMWLPQPWGWPYACCVGPCHVHFGPYPVMLKPEIPHEFSLEQNHPNPFNPETQIRYALPHATQVKLVLYNILGRKVRTLVDEYQTAGYKIIQWDGKDDNGGEVASGIYFYRLQAGEYNETRKMVMVK